MDDLTNLATTLWSRFSTNLQASVAHVSPQKWIQLVIIVGAYMLLRPYLIKLGSKSQMQSHEAAEEHEAMLTPNDLRGQYQIPEDSDTEVEEEGASATASGPDWGKKARRRQRDMIKKLLEVEEQRLMESKEEEEDKDIEEFLVE